MTVVSPLGWGGGVFSPRATCVLAPNPGMMTLDGTNTWVLREGARSIVIDPGPLGDGHLERIREAHVRYFMEVRSIVAGSKPEVAALVNVQLLTFDKDPL